MNTEESIPISTIDISLDSGIQSEDGSKLTHLHQVPFFQQFTIDEIRYYDYLKAGYISIVKPEKPQFFHQQTQGFNNSDQFNETTTYHEVSPWSIEFPNIPELNSYNQAQQIQPYGAFPDSQIIYQNQFEQENLSDQQQNSFNFNTHPHSSFFNQFNNFNNT